MGSAADPHHLCISRCYCGEMKDRPFRARMRFAIAGVVVCWRERSFRTQARLAAMGAVAVAVLRLPAPWVAMFVVSAAVVLALEAMNTAIEQLADTLHPQQSAGIGRAKDAAAASVLIAGCGAVTLAILGVVRGFP